MYRMMRFVGRYKSARFDLKDASPRGRKSNFMDLNSSSGFALAILYVLKLADGAGLVHFGIKCGSFCGLNRGTSGRSACTPYGNIWHPSVIASNKLLERTTLLILLCTAMNGTWTIEQPEPGVVPPGPEQLAVLMGGQAENFKCWATDGGTYVQAMELCDELERQLQEDKETSYLQMQANEQLETVPVDILFCVNTLEASLSDLVKAGLMTDENTLVDPVVAPANIGPDTAGPDTACPQEEHGSPCKSDAYAVVDVAQERDDDEELEQASAMDMYLALTGLLSDGESDDAENGVKTEPDDTEAKMVKEKSRRKDLQVPAFVREQWESGNRSSMAQLLQQVNFNKDEFVASLEVQIKKKNKVLVEVEEGWYSKEEMLNDLNWLNAYDGQEEFWIQVRELGKRKHSQSYEETHKKIKQADDLPEVPKCLQGFKELDDLNNRLMLDGTKPSAGTQQGQTGLEMEIKLMEAQYDKCCELKAQAESQGMSEEILALLYKAMESRIKEVTVVSSTQIDAVLASLCQRDEDQEQHAVGISSSATSFLKIVLLGCSASAKVAKASTAKKYYDKHDKQEKPHAATCRSAIRTARNLVSDLGDQAGSVAGLRELASCSETHSERDTNRLLTGKFGLALPIPIKTIPGMDGGLPIFRLRDWLSFLLKINGWHHLCGLKSSDPPREKAIWSAFWERYRALDPGHDIFKKADEGLVNLERCAAMLLHGDEGRGRRRQAFMVVSYHSCLGRGTAAAQRASKASKVKKPYLKMKTNFAGHTYTTRFLAGAMTKQMYHDNEDMFANLMTSIADEALHLATCGVADRYGQKHWMVILRTVGDWPWLHRAAKLKRTYANVVKRLDQKAGGICHLCDAGSDDVPFEEIGTRRPQWLATMYRTSPFEAAPFMARAPHNPQQLAAHYAFDVFHTVQLGIGRYLTGTMLALWSDRETGNVEDRFEALTVKYKAFCKATGRATHVSRLTKDLIQWGSTTDFPAASWYKGHLTTTVMEFLQHLGESIDLEGDDVELLLSMGTEAVVALNDFMRLLYELDVWVPPDDARRAGELSAKFLRRYNDCAVRARSLQRTLFPIQPKFHCLHHLALELLRASNLGLHALNPIVLSTQQSEDFIGRPSRLSRRVSSRGTVVRVMQRYLQSCYTEWVKAGLLVEAAGPREK
ncbi:unnamed protein product [Symbiodinium necroappetens]|uniref:Uncharacterized protein n=1 Tax=Symbiodinium necroappetens TaxID=1628268 RepID=A0A813CH77_9DINO|nr:unnamed protein product [Symbiodinium necroappetens]